MPGYAQASAGAFACRRRAALLGGAVSPGEATGSSARSLRPRRAPWQPPWLVLLGSRGACRLRAAFGSCWRGRFAASCQHLWPFWPFLSRHVGLRRRPWSIAFCAGPCCLAAPFSWREHRCLPLGCCSCPGGVGSSLFSVRFHPLIFLRADLGRSFGVLSPRPLAVPACSLYRRSSRHPGGSRARKMASQTRRPHLSTTRCCCA